MTKQELSNTLKNLKFMQRASQKVEKFEKEQVIPAEDFPSSTMSKRCVVVVEGEPHPGTKNGRMSFLNFNPSIDKLNEEAFDLGQNGSTDTSSGRHSGTTPTRETTSPQDNLEFDILGKDGDLKRKHPDISSGPPYPPPTNSFKYSLDHQDSSPSSSHGSQKQHKSNKLDWSVLLPPKHQNKKRQVL